MAKSGTKIIMASLAGLAAGFALGVLFAPEKGSKTRKKLKKKLKGVAETLGEKYPENMGFLKNIFTGKTAEENEEDENGEKSEGSLN